MYNANVPPELFYTGLIADLYEPLAGGLPKPEPYQRFIDRYGSPTLELGCGSGLPMLDLIELGYDVEGLDASADMLRVCRDKALERGLSPKLHQGLFQAFSVNRTFKTIYIPSASFTLLTSDEDALATLNQVFQHLSPGGALYLPLEVFEPQTISKGLNQFKEARDPQGNLLRVGMTAIEISADGRDLQVTLRYEKHTNSHKPEVVNRVWQRRCWTSKQIATLIEAAGFTHQKVLGDPSRGSFLVIAEK